MNIGIYIYDNAEVLDFSGPFEVFSTAARLAKLSDLYHVFLVAETNAPVKARGGYSVNPSYSFDNHPAIDVLIVVGGEHHAELQKANVIQWVSEQAKTAKIVASVCTGAFILATAEVIIEQKVTTHQQDLADLQHTFPSLQVINKVRWVEDGNIITSAGISAGIDMSLHLIEKLHCKALAIRTAEQMQYSWQEHEEVASLI